MAISLGDRAGARSARATPRYGLILAACCLGQFVVMLDGSIMNVALPAIQEALGFTPTGLQWVINAFMIPTAGLLLLGGRLADLYGRRRVFLIGTVLFSLACLVGGLAPDPGTLVAARGLQGVGAALIAPATLTVLGTTFTTPAGRAKAFGLWGAVAGAGGAVGVLAGGVVTEWLSWRWVLLVNVPIGVVLYLMVAAAVAESRREGTGRLDVLGAVSATLGIVAIAYGLSDAGAQGWTSPTVLGSLVVGVALLAVFLVDQARWAANPMIPLDVFRNRSVSAANVVMLCAGAALAATFYFLTLLMQYVLLWTPLQTGLAYLPLAVCVMVGAGGMSVLIEKVGVRPVLVAGLVPAILGLAWLATDGVGTEFWSGVFGPTVLFGLGIGMVMATVATAATDGVPYERQGLTSGMVTTSQALGGSAGLAALVTVAASVSGAASPTTDAGRAALADGYGWGFLACAGLLACSLLASVAIPRRVSEPPEVPADA